MVWPDSYEFFCHFFQVIPVISSLTPYTTALPLIGVLLLTAIKDAYDDIVSTNSIILQLQNNIDDIFSNSLLTATSQNGPPGQ